MITKGTGSITKRRGVLDRLMPDFTRLCVVTKGIRLPFFFLFMLFFLLNACRTEDMAESTATRTTDLTDSEPVTITFAGYGFDRLSYEPSIQTFNEMYPNIGVQFVSMTEATGEQTGRLDARELASLADVILLDGKPASEAPAYFMDLAPLLAADDAFDPNDFWPGLLNSCRIGENLVGVPVGVSASLVFFDDDAFTAAGLPSPQPGWTWPAFQQAAQLLTQESGDQKQYGFVAGANSMFLLGPLVDGLIDDGKNLDPEEAAASLNWYVDLARSGVISVETNETSDQETNADAVDAVDSEALINQGQAAMWLGSQFEWHQRRETWGEGIGVVPFPILPDGDAASTTPLRPACALISAGSSHPQAAWAWLHFLTRQVPPGARQAIPVRPSVTETGEYWNNWDAAARETLAFALTHGWYGDYSSPPLATVAEALDQAVAGESSLAEALPATIQTSSTPAPPPLDSTPVAVATPRTTSTPIALPQNVPPGDTIVVEYYADLTAHSDQSAVEALVNAFNEAQNRIVVQPFTDRPAFQGNYGIVEMAGTYDCFVWGGAASNFPQITEHFYSLDPLLAAEDISLSDDFYPALLEQNLVMGELYGLPMLSQPLVIQYHADHFDRLGLEPPPPNWTVDDFWALATEATEDGAAENKVYGFVPYIWGTMDLLLLTPEAPQLYDATITPPRVGFNELDVTQALSGISSMVHAGVMFPKDRSTPSQIQQQRSIILEGQAAMWVDLAGSGGYEFAVGEAPLPVMSAPLPIANSTSGYISKRTDDPTGCWEWLKFLSAQADAFQGIPARKSILESPTWTAVVGEETASVYRATLSRPVQSQPDLNDANFYVPFPFFVWWEEALQAGFSDADATAVLDDIQIKADAYLLCITTAEVRDFVAVESCAKQADPGYSPEF